MLKQIGFALLTAGLMAVWSAVAGVPVSDSPDAERVRQLLSGQRVMVLGDSITQNGMYVSFLEFLLQKAYPGAKPDIISVGLSSETVSGLSEQGHAGGAFPRPCLFERLGRALTAVKPRLVLACYGMNDGIYQPFSEERFKAFQDGIRRLVKECQAAGAEVVLVTPPVFDQTRSKADVGYDRTLARYSEWVLKEMHPPALAVVDIHTEMRVALEERRKADPGYYFSGDAIHPNDLGHLLMARSILKGLGVSIGSQDLEAQYEQVKKDQVFELTHRRRAARSGAWLANIGYTRERHVAPKTGDIEKAEAESRALQERIDSLKK